MINYVCNRKLSSVKQYIVLIALISSITACRQQEKIIVDPFFVDSLISHQQPSEAAISNENEMQFWKARIDAQPSGFTNEGKYAATLSRRFHIYGDIDDILKADSIVRSLNEQLNGKDVGPLLSLTGYAILQHQFNNAADYVQQLKVLGSEKYTVSLLSFDTDFELGNYYGSSEVLKAIRNNNDYGYFFRLSKYEHLKGNINASIAAMERAAELGVSNDYLKQAALSNLADLYLHAADLQKAANLYQQCIRMNSCDFHSIMGLGWLALMNDKNDSLAERIFQFVHLKTKSPDPVFKLSQVAAQRGDSVMQDKFAREYVQQVSNIAYGNMYNKYLIELYTGILHNPEKAETIAGNELRNRATAQTYAWYAWSLYANNKRDEAYKVYQQHISGKPLEGLELYWMGKLMSGLGKGYNAKEYFKAAMQNRYDLSPDMKKDLEDSLKK